MPFRPQLYKDLNKRANDLITKDFPSEKRENKVDWKGETANGVVFETSLLQKSDGSVLGTFSPKYRLKEWNTTLSAELKTNRDFKFECVIDNHFTPGLKTTITEESKGEDIFATVGLEYRHDLVAVTGSVDYGQAAGSNIKASAVIGAQGFQLGSSVDYFLGNTTESALREFGTTASYSNDEFDVNLFGKIISDKDSNILGGSYYQRVNADTQVGGEISFDTQNPDTKPKLTAALQHRLEADASIKAKFDTNGKLGLSWQQRFKSSRLTLSTTMDTNNFGSKGSNVGFNLTLF